MTEESRIEQKRPRGTGCIYQQKGSSNWWVQYYRNGKAYRQSAGTTDRRKAERFLQRKLGEIAIGNFLEPSAEKVLVKELAADLEIVHDLRLCLHGIRCGSKLPIGGWHTGRGAACWYRP